MDIFTEATATIERACGHEDAVKVRLDDDLEPAVPEIRRAEIALCESCYEKWAAS